MNAAILGILLGLPAGWLVNVLADTIPPRLSFQETWRWPLQRLGLLSAPSTPAAPTRGRYILVWLAALALGGFAYARLGITVEALLVALEAWFFLVVAVIDLEHRLVLNRMIVPAAPVILVANLLLREVTINALLLGAAAGFGFFLLLALLAPGGMGMGDVKLAGLIGLTIGLSNIVVAIFIAIFVGGIAGAAILIQNRILRRPLRGQTMAYAPYLVMGVWVVLFDGIGLLHNYLEHL